MIHSSHIDGPENPDDRNEGDDPFQPVGDGGEFKSFIFQKVKIRSAGGENQREFESDDPFFIMFFRTNTIRLYYLK